MRSFLTRCFYANWILALFILLLVVPIVTHAGYLANPSSSTTGDNNDTNDGTTPLRITAVASETSNNVSFHIGRSDGAGFQTSGTISMRECGSGGCNWFTSTSISSGQTGKTFSVYMPQYVTGVEQVDFYGEYQADNGYFTEVGPIRISAPSLSMISGHYETAVDAYSATLNWPSITGANSYRYQISKSSNLGSGSSCSFCIPNGNDTTTNTFVTFSNLEPNTTYFWHVRAGNTVTQQGSNYSSIRQFTTAPPPPLPTPTGLTIGYIDSDSIDLSWNPVSAANTYRFQVTDQNYFNDSADGNTCYNCIAGGNGTISGIFGTFVRIDGLVPGQPYRLRVRAGNTNTAQGSEWANTSYQNPNAQPQVSNLRLNSDSFSSGETQTLNWQSSNQHHYFFYLYDANGVSPVNTSAFLASDCAAGGADGTQGCLGQANPSSSTSDSWRVPGNLASGTYTIKLVVWGGSSTAHTFSSPFTVNQVGFPAPILVSPAHSATQIDTTTQSYSWQSVTDAGVYRIVVSAASDFAGFNETTFTCDASCQTEIINQNTTFPGFELSPNTTYYWRVRAGDPGIFKGGVWSSIRSFTTGGVTQAFPQPAMLTPGDGATNVSLTTQGFSWDPVDGANSYRVVVSNDQGFAALSSDGFTCVNNLTCRMAVTPDTSYPGFSLSPGKTYYWKVRAGNTITEQGGHWPNFRSFTTMESAVEANKPTLVISEKRESALVGQTVAIKLIARDVDGDLDRIEFDWGQNGNPIPRPTSHGQEQIFTITPDDTLANKILRWSALAFDTQGNASSPLVTGSISILPAPTEPVPDPRIGLGDPENNQKLNESCVPPECSCRVAKPIDLATGAQVETRSLLSVYGVVPIDLTINYNSLLLDVGLIGRGWQISHGYAAQLAEVNNDNVIIYWSKNRYNTFTRNTDGTYMPLQFACRFDVLTKQEDGTFKITQRDRRTYYFDAQKRLARIENHLGQALEYEFNNLNQLVRITEPVSNVYLAFEYSNSLLTRVTDPEGNAVAFEYTNQNLTKITRADGIEELFTYNALGQILTRTLDGVLVETNEHDSFGRVIRQDDSRSDNDVATFSYFTEGEKTRTIFTDRIGARWEYLHDEKNRLERLVNPLLEVVQHTYDNEKGTRKSTTDARGFTTQYEHNDIGDPTKTIFPDGTSVERVYSNRNVIQIIDQKGQTEQFGYDSHNFQTSHTDKKGNTTTFTPNANHQIIRIQTPENRVTTRTYADGRLASETNPENHTRTISYDAAGRIETQSDFGGFVTRYERDGMGRKTKQTDPLGRIERWTYNARGQEAIHADAKGRTTESFYNGEGDLVRVLEPADPVLGVVEWHYEVDGEGRRTKTTDPKGHVTTFDLDALGREVSRRDPLEYRFGTKYDANGNVVENRAPHGGRVRTTYDNLNRVTEVKNRLNHLTSYDYDANGNTSRMADPEGRVTQYQHDPNDNVIRVIFPGNGIASEQGFDADQVLTSVTDPNGHTRVLDTNGNGQTETETTADNIDIDYEYNARGLVSKVTNGRRQEAIYRYDNAGRQIQRSDGLGPVTYGWDDSDNLRTVTENGITSTRELDSRDRVIRYEADGSSDTTIEYNWDKNDNLKQIDYPGGGSSSYQYDVANQLTQVSGFGLSAVYELDGKGRLVKTTYGNGLEESRRYDAADRLTLIRLQKANGDLIHEIKQSYDKSGKVTRVDMTPDAPATSTYIRDASYNYTDANRLQDRTYTSDTTTPSDSFDNDGDGHIMSLAGSELSLSEPQNGVSHANVIDIDVRGRMTRAGNYEYAYHAEDYRYALTHVLGDTRHVTRYVVNPIADLDQVIIEHKPDGSSRTYVYGYGLIGEKHSNGNIYYHHHDYRGSVIAVSNLAGEIIARFGYTDYGQRFAIEGNIDTSFGFNGRDGVMTDPNGLLYARARYYSPDQGRFLAKDPLRGEVGDLTALNRYAYVGGDPVNLIDPSGLAAIDYYDRYFEAQDQRIVNAIIQCNATGERCFEAYGGAIFGIATNTAAEYFGFRDVACGNFFDATTGFFTKKLNRIGNLASQVKKKADNVFSVSKNGLPKNPNDLKKQGYIETSHPDAVKRGHRTFENMDTGDKVRFDKGKPDTTGYLGKDHYHRYNPSATSKKDQYLDKNGNPCARGCSSSHLIPKE